MAAISNSRGQRQKRLLALFLALTMVLAACGSSSQFSSGVSDVGTDTSDDSSEFENINAETTDSDDSMDEEAMDDDEGAVATSATIPAADNNSDLGTGGNDVATQRSPAELGREIIFTATINVGVDDVAASGAEAAAIIEDLDGFIFGQQTQGGAEPRTVLVFKVRPADFQTALERLGNIGELRNQSITTDDVTERVVDLQSRIQTTELGVERLRTAMEATTNLEDFARLEEQLLRRESDLEVLKGTLRTLRDQIDLATITLTLEQDRVANGIELAFSIYEGHDVGAACPGTGGNGFEPGDEVTLCIEAINVGDQTLTNLNVTDTVLEIESLSDLITVFGDPDDIQPGQSVMLAYELDAKRDVNLRLNLTATPTDGVSIDAAGPAVRTQSSPNIRVDEEAADPGFGDGFGAAVSVLLAIWTTVTVLAGFIIPLLVLLPIFWLVWVGVRKLLAARRARAAAEHAANQPPPPARVPAAPPSEASADEDE